MVWLERAKVNQMSDENSIGRREYRESIKTSAEEIASEAEDEMDVTEMVETTVDADSWIIHYGYNTDVLEVSDNEPEEWKHMISDGTYWKEVIQAMAYDVMRQDLHEAVREIRNGE